MQATMKTASNPRIRRIVYDDFTTLMITTDEGDKFYIICTEDKFQLHEHTATLADEDVPNEYTRLHMPLLMPQVTDEDIYKMNLENLAIEVAGISSY
jgi:hypothetical protein